MLAFFELLRLNLVDFFFWGNKGIAVLTFSLFNIGVKETTLPGSIIKGGGNIESKHV